MHATTCLIAFHPLEAVLLAYYAKVYDRQVIQVLRGMLRKCVLADPHLDVQALGAWMGKVDELTADKALMQEARRELKSFVERRAGRMPTTSPETLQAYTRRTDVFNVAQFTCRFTAFELLLLDYYAGRAYLSREQTLRQFLRLYVLADKKLDRKKLQIFAHKLSQSLKKAERDRLECQFESFFAARK